MAVRQSELSLTHAGNEPETKDALEDPQSILEEDYEHIPTNVVAHLRNARERNLSRVFQEYIKSLWLTFCKRSQCCILR